MAETIVTALSTPRLRISSDSMCAMLDPEPNGRGWALAAVLAEMRRRGVTPIDEERLTSLADAEGILRFNETLVLAEGQRPEDDVPAQFEMLIKPKPAEECASYYERTAFLTVEADQPVALLLPNKTGSDGIDIFGLPVRRRRTTAAQPTIGVNLVLKEDGKTICATTPGRVCQKGSRLWVEAALKIDKDVDFSVGNISFHGDISIRGTILDLFKVKGTSIFVDKAIEAAFVDASHDIHVAGGILAKDKGHCHAGHNITCRYVSNGVLVAGNDVIVHSEIANSRITCGGKLVVKDGPLASGHAAANGGVICRTLGSPAAISTLVEVGLDYSMLQMAAPMIALIDHKILALRHLNDEAATLFANRKNLSRSQKERATELLYDQSEAKRVCEEGMNQLRQAYEASQVKAKAEVEVADVLHAGVTIRFPTAEATVTTDWKGPVRVMVQENAGENTVMVIDPKGGMCPLVTRVAHHATQEGIKRLLAAPRAVAA